MADFLAKFCAPAKARGSQVKLIDLEQYRRKEVIETLKELLAAAEAGNMEGLVYVAKVGPGDHRAGTAGTYRRFPEKALQATFALERHLAKSGPFAESQ